MINKTRTLYTHAWFAISGRSWTTPDAGGPVARETLPPVDAADANGVAIFIPMGIIADSDYEGKEDLVEIWKGNPGVLEVYEEISTKRDATVKMVCKQSSVLLFQLLHGTLDLSLADNASALQYNESEGKYHAIGFLKTQVYDQDNVFVDSRQCFGRLKIDGAVKMNGESVDWSLDFRKWQSSHNSGILLPA